MGDASEMGRRVLAGGLVVRACERSQVGHVPHSDDHKRFARFQSDGDISSDTWREGEGGREWMGKGIEPGRIARGADRVREIVHHQDRGDQKRGTRKRRSGKGMQTGSII